MSSVTIPQDQWSGFLQDFSREHSRWLVKFETHDRKTDERVVTKELPLQSIELDLEDETAPRINVTVEMGNKTVKHILFMPSALVFYLSQKGREEELRVETVNTSTRIHLRAAASMPESGAA